MVALLEFECRVPVDGYRILTFDERKFIDAEPLDPESDDLSVLPPNNATEDERYLLRRWGTDICPTSELIADGFEPEVKEILEPQSDRIRRYDLFGEAPDAFIEFANSPFDAEGARVLANRFGPLFGDGAEYVESWRLSIENMGTVVKVWERAKATGDLRRIARSVSRWGRLDSDYGRLFPPDVDRIDAHIFFREDPLSGAPRLHVSPPTLAVAFWTQLALAIDGSQSLRTCIECRKWFTLKSGEGRSDKEYCSNACRMRAYRKRKGHGDVISRPRRRRE